MTRSEKLVEEEIKVIYELPPQDWHFGTFSVNEEHESLAQAENMRQKLIVMATDLLRAHSQWEGDITEAFVGSVPSGYCEPFYYVTIKQGNNGTTYIVSYIDFDWLDPFKVYKRTERRTIEEN